MTFPACPFDNGETRSDLMKTPIAGLPIALMLTADCNEAFIMNENTPTRLELTLLSVQPEKIVSSLYKATEPRQR